MPEPTECPEGPEGPECLAADAGGIARATAIWRAGGLVAFPTETVYGLGADARDDRAVARIFEAKGRPRFNPLIVHVDSVARARGLVHWPEAAERLAAAIWPGPLTLVLPLRDDAGLSPLVTAGLGTVAVRVPEHPVARALLAEFGGPLAAPSANPSGRISPTNAAHVRAGLAGRIDAVVDGGACAVGVESTILGLAGAPVLLRPGGVPVETLETVLGAAVALHARPTRRARRGRCARITRRGRRCGSRPRRRDRERRCWALARWRAI